MTEKIRLTPIIKKIFTLENIKNYHKNHKCLFEYSNYDYKYETPIESIYESNTIVDLYDNMYDKYFDDYEEYQKTDIMKFIIPEFAKDTLTNLDFNIEEQKELKSIIKDLIHFLIQNTESSLDYTSNTDRDECFKLIPKDSFTLTKQAFYQIYDVIEYIINNIYDTTIDDIINNKTIDVNLYPNQDENMNTEGFSLKESLDIIRYYIYQENDNTETQKSLPENYSDILVDLFKSQGYTFEDLKEPNKVKNSKFLSSFIDEVKNSYSDDPEFFVMLVNLSIEDYYKLKSCEYEITLNQPMCGLFDPVMGSGSILEVKLEKPYTFKYNKTDQFNEPVLDKKSCYGYSVNTVYGLCTSAWTKKYSLTKI